MDMNAEKEILSGRSNFRNPQGIKKFGIFLIVLGILSLAGVIFLVADGNDELASLLLIPPILILVGVLLILGGRNSITITDKRVYGKDIFGSRVDLPFDMISAVGTNHFLRAISVATASGKIRFLFIRNVDDLHACINEKLIERQSGTGSKTESASSAEELKTFKDLLDSGVITQEEFDAKKKQILGL